MHEENGERKRHQAMYGFTQTTTLCVWFHACSPFAVKQRHMHTKRTDRQTYMQKRAHERDGHTRTHTHTQERERDNRQQDTGQTPNTEKGTQHTQKDTEKTHNTPHMEKDLYTHAPVCLPDRALRA